MNKELTLAGRHILIVEDEPFIAFDLAGGIEEAGGDVIGPAMSLKNALELVATEAVDAAILDVNLPDGDVGPVIAELSLAKVPFVIHTGAGLTPSIANAFPGLRVYPKPTSPRQLAAILLEMLANH